MKKIKYIIFDLGAVLLNIDYQKTIDEFKKLGVKNASEFYSKKKQINIFDLLECGKISEQRFVDEFKEISSRASDAEIISAWNALLLDLPQNRINLLKRIRKKYDIFLLSNTNSIHINEFRKQIGETKYLKFYNLFKKVYYSYEIGFRKPNKEAFQIILNENNMNPKEVLFIDDSPQHITGARVLGIQTYHLKDNEDVSSVLPDIIQ